MFRAVPMLHLQLLILTSCERAVLEGMGNLGAVHLTRTQPELETAMLSPADHTAEMSQYDRIKSRIQELRQSLEISPLLEAPKTLSLTLVQAEEKLLTMEQRCKNLLVRRQSILHRLKELSGIGERLSPYHGLDIPLDGPERYLFLHFVTGNLPIQNYEGLLNEVGDRAIVFPSVQQKGQQSILAVTTINGWESLEKILQQAGFQQEALPVAEGKTVDGMLEEADKEKESLSADFKDLDDKLKSIASEIALPLAEIEVFVNREYQILEASQKFSRTKKSVFISGWIPFDNISSLEKLLDEITGGVYKLETSQPDVSDDMQIPVLLRHSRLLRPFSMLVSTYGLPNYRELEPTLFVALSYVVMFGLMFGDVGHGMVLVAFGLIALLVPKFHKAKDFGVLLLSGGLSSMIFGVIYGSYFGIEELKKYAIWHDPLDCNPMYLMYGAITIGIILISIGLILNVINRFKKGDFIGGLLDKFGLVGLLFYWGTLLLLINWSTIQSRGLIVLSMIIVIAVPIVGWSLKEPLEHIMKHKKGEHGETAGGFGEALIESCVGAFEAILSYLANTISFVRLAAYAMSHAALLFAAFMLAAEVKNFPYGGSFLNLFVIIMGNIVAIVLEGVIASVQALRLEYYEFFGKFFSGDGQPFVPFSLTPRDKNSPM